MVSDAGPRLSPDTGPMLVLACPPDSLGSSMVGGDGLEPPTLSV